MSRHVTAPGDLRFDLHLGIETRSDEPGTCHASLVLGPEHRNIVGWIHGGVLVSILDTAMGHALATLAERGVEAAATMQLSCQFLDPPRDSRLEAVGTVVRLGGSSAFVEGTLRDGTGGVVARAHGVWRVWREKGRERGDRDGERRLGGAAGDGTRRSRDA